MPERLETSCIAKFERQNRTDGNVVALECHRRQDWTRVIEDRLLGPSTTPRWYLYDVKPSLFLTTFQPGWPNFSS